MSALICKRTMRECSQPDMCAPYEGCGEPARAPVQAQGVALPADFQPLETVKYWAEAFAKDPQRLAGGMIVKLVQEYAQLRAALDQAKLVAREVVAHAVAKELLKEAIFDKVARAEDLMQDMPPHRAMARYNEATSTLNALIDQLYATPPDAPAPVLTDAKEGE